MKRRDSLKKATSLILLFSSVFLLASCANMDRKIKEVNIKSPIKEPVTSLALIFARPVAGFEQDPGLMNGYRLAGVFDQNLMRRSGERIAEFLTLNDVSSTYVGEFGMQIDMKGMLSGWAGKGHHPVLFVPVGSKVTTQNGTPIAGFVRYRITVYSKNLTPMIEFYDDFRASGWNSNYVDTAAATWLNTLIENGYVGRTTSEKLKQPTYRDFVKEDANSKKNAK